jgi:hypothetical protein
MNSNHEAEGESHYTLDDKVGPSQQEKHETIATITQHGRHSY